ncbi:MAG: Cj0069 family protein [Chloroflexota bacterium]
MTRAIPRRVGVLWRADRHESLSESRYGPVGAALAARGLAVEAVPYTDDAVDDVRRQLLALDGVLVWVDPIAGGQNRSTLDLLLREVASQGVWVSTHPEVILRMGTKDVLVKTRDMDWGSDCYLYASPSEMAAQLPARLALGPRVLKQHRGNGGNGVWKVELLGQPEVLYPRPRVRVLHAQRGSSLEPMDLDEFLEQCEGYFTNAGCMIDQPYQTRLADGMIRCYIVQDRIAGFGHQFVTALLPPPEGTIQSPAPPPRLYYGPSKPEFQRIKAKLEGGWIGEMQQALGIADSDLPVLWDADFLYGPTDAAGDDTYVLCEINVSCVSPFPDEVLTPLVNAVAHRLSVS